MKSFCIVALALVAVYAADGAYTSDEGVNIKATVKDPNEIKKLLDCFAGNSECSKHGAALKADLPKALATACSECTPQQKQYTLEFFEAAKKHFTPDYEALLKKLDPDNKLFPVFYKAIGGN